MTDDLIKALQKELRQADDRIAALEQRIKEQRIVIVELRLVNERIAELEASLKPFADFAHNIDVLTSRGELYSRFPLSALSNARKALEEK